MDMDVFPVLSVSLKDSSKNGLLDPTHYTAVHHNVDSLDTTCLLRGFRRIRESSDPGFRKPCPYGTCRIAYISLIYVVSLYINYHTLAQLSTQNKTHRHEDKLHLRD
ncbi:hypothetical protein ACRALDRAFT_213758 [Sodiomyces alcalophilus JCM 7366]|uniref:uncharacterized protein n=1 Tax=Sodiomyces alcalophilus JCM 7366 TaxID=591952 RepID=UPI0039B3B22C